MASNTLYTDNNFIFKKFPDGKCLRVNKQTDQITEYSSVEELQAAVDEYVAGL